MNLKELIEEHKPNLESLDLIAPDSIKLLYESLVKDLTQVMEAGDEAKD